MDELSDARVVGGGNLTRTQNRCVVDQLVAKPAHQGYLAFVELEIKLLHKPTPIPLLIPRLLSQARLQ